MENLFKNLLDYVVSDEKQKRIPINIYTPEEFNQGEFNKFETNWMLSNGFSGKAGEALLIPNECGDLSKLIIIISKDSENIEAIGKVAHLMPKGSYELNSKNYEKAILGFLLKQYDMQSKVKIVVKNKDLLLIAKAIYVCKDLINLPVSMLNTTDFAKFADNLLKLDMQVQIHEDLSKFPGIYAVGKSGADKPLLFEATYTPENYKKTICLIGKGVTFDTGGVNLKSDAGMRNMKKDMSGGAVALALTKMIVDLKLPVKLKLLIPMAENGIGSKAQKPGDIITMHDGTKVLVEHTDAEGRIILGDAIAFAGKQKYDYLFSIASLTGAISVALSNDLPGIYTTNEQTGRDLVAIGEQEEDRVWQMPFYQKLKPSILTKDGLLKNATLGDPCGGSIKAALFLQHFVSDNIKEYIHVDNSFWNAKENATAGVGGHPHGIRTLLKFIINQTK